jgi:hypothetical protein
MKRTRIARGASIAGAVGLLAALLSRGGTVPAPVDAAAGPFQCQPGFYQVMSGQLYELNPVTSVYTKIGSAYSTSYNAMGYNVEDNYLYAMGTGTTDEAHLLRIADDGSVTDLGQPSGLPTHDYVSGDMDGTGHLLVQLSASTWYAIDVSTGTATSITVTGTTGSGNDAVWIDGYLYFASNDILYTINLTTDHETDATVSGLPASASYGAAWSDKPSDMFISNNADGDIYQISGFTGTTPSATQVATGDATGDNDGAACKQSASPFVLPVANADTYAVTTDVTLSVDAAGGVLANDSGAGLTVLSHTNPSDGTLTLNSDGSFTYVPGAGFQGTDSFTYSVQDEYGRDSAAPATVTLDVNLPPAPQAGADSYTTPAGTTLSVDAGSGLLANDTGTSISVFSHTTPAGGSLSLNSNGSFSYVPAAGTSAIESFSYTIEDGFSRTSSAGVTIDVTPTVVAGSGTTAYATPLSEASPGVLSGAVGSGLTVASYGQPSHGTVSVNADGSFTYTPSSGFAGTDHFGFVASDSSSQSVDGTFSVGVGEPAAPDASAYGLTTPADTSLVRTGATGLLSDDSGASIAVTSHSEPSHGSLTVSADGAFTYAPTSGFSGHDSFSYTITDAVGQTATNTVSIAVTPVAVTQTYDTPYATSIGVNVLDDDIGSGLSIQYIITAPGSGEWGASGFGSISYDPPAGFAGTVEFTYDMMDSSDQSATGTLYYDVGDPAPPLAQPDTYTTAAGTTLVVSAAEGVLSNDTGSGIFVASNTYPESGLLSVASDGSFSYAPAAGSSGVYTFSYTIADAVGQFSSAEVTIAVTPTVDDGSGTTAYATPLTEAAPGVLAGALGSGLTVPSYGQPLHGTVAVSSDGSFTYTPDAGFDGSDSFTFVAEDAAGQTADGSFTVGVDAPAAPEASAYGFTVAADSSLVQGDAQGLLLDDSGTSISVTGNSDPADGTLSLDPAGGFTYTPTSGFSGYDSFTYTITDVVGQTASNTVYLDVTPVAVTQTYDTPYETGVAVNVLSDDIGSGLSYYVLTEPGVGQWGASEFGVISFYPPAGFVGLAEFTYHLMDGSGQWVNGELYYDVLLPAPPVVGGPLDYTTAAGQLLEVTEGGLLTGATGALVQVASNGAPAHGLVSVNADGTFEYQPAPGFSGVDHFDFTITDPFDQTGSGEATITVEPVANDVAYSTPCGEDVTMTAPGGLLGLDLGTSLAVSDVSGTPAVGGLDWQPDGSFVFTPAAGECATSGGFGYTITDQDDQQASATVTFEVGPPAAVLDRSYSADEGVDLAVGAGSGLIDWSTTPGVTVVTYTQPSHGSVTAGPDGSFTYTPAPGYSGPDSFTYTAEDAGGVLGIGTVSISVAPAAVPSATAPTPDTGAGEGAVRADLAGGLLLILLGAASLVAFRRRRRPIS